MSLMQNSNEYFNGKINNFENIQDYTSIVKNIKSEDSASKNDRYDNKLHVNINDDNSKVLKNGLIIQYLTILISIKVVQKIFFFLHQKIQKHSRILI